MSKELVLASSLASRRTRAAITPGRPVLEAAIGPLTYHSITPFRSVATPSVGMPKLLSNQYTDWDLWTDINSNAQIPSTIKAVTFNLTITQTEGAAFLALVPADADFAGVSTINWTNRNVDLANNGTVGVGPRPHDGLAGCVSVICGGVGSATHYLIDVTGYYI